MKVLALLLAFAVFPAALRAQKQNAPLPSGVTPLRDLEYDRPGGSPTSFSCSPEFLSSPPAQNLTFSSSLPTTSGMPM